MGVNLPHLLKNMVRKWEKQCFYVRRKIRRKIKKLFTLVGKRFFMSLERFLPAIVQVISSSEAIVEYA